MNLIASSEEYFKNKYSDHTSNFDETQIDHIAKILGKTSIIINDIKRGRMSPILVDENIQTTLEEFEKAGGAYLMYTLCRAKSVLSKSSAVDVTIVSEES
jgi:arginyl-tRNA synthetase